MSEKKTRNDYLRALIECAILIALGTILAQIKIFRMPNGGSVTAASMVPFLLIAYRHGTKWGLLSSFANVLLQIVLGGIYPPVAPGALAYIAEILFDYFFAYMVLGLGFLFYKPFKNKPGFAVGFSTFVCCFLRFLSSFISGFLVWADIAQDGFFAVTYSLGYNAAYLGPETFVTVVVMCLLFKTAPQIFDLE